MAATTGTLKSSSCWKASWQDSDSAAISFAELARSNMLMSAPAMKLPGLVERITRPLRPLVALASAITASNCWPNSAFSVFCASPGTLTSITPTPSGRRLKRKADSGAAITAGFFVVDGLGMTYSASRTIAAPMPPAAQAVVSARPPPRRCNSFRVCTMMRAPVAPKGWP